MKACQESAQKVITTWSQPNAKSDQPAQGISHFSRVTGCLVELLQDILESAGELEERVPYEALVTTTFAKAVP